MISLSFSLEASQKISAGLNHSLAVKTDGTVYAWGDDQDADGFLGTGVTESNVTANQVLNLTDISSVYTGTKTSFAIDTNASLWVWGDNRLGQLGDGTENDISEPKKLDNFTNVKSIAAGTDHTIALKNDGTVWAWGYNGEGQLGVVTATDRSLVPIQVTGLSDIASIAVHYHHSYAVKSDGSVWAWGNNDWGQLGVADGTLDPQPVPIQITALSNVASIDSGNRHVVALKKDGTVVVWGENSLYQLGDNTLSATATPVSVASLSGVIAISAGGFHTAVLKDDGTVWAWGYNSNGKLGVSVVGIQPSGPVQMAYVSGVTEISAESDLTLMLKEDHSLVSIGPGDANGNRNYNANNRGVPVVVEDMNQALSNVQKITASKNHTPSIIKTDGTLWRWGTENLGNPLSVTSSLTSEVLGLKDVLKVQETDYGTGDTTALTSTGDVYWWKNFDNQLAQKISSLSNITDIVSGSSHTLALKSDGTVWAWGGNSEGQLGDATEISQYLDNGGEVVQMKNVSDAVKIFALYNRSYVLRANGTLWSVGRNLYGALGDDTKVDRSELVQVLNISDIKSLTGSLSRTFAIKNDGTLWAWGDNNNGELCDGTGSDRLRPVQISGISNVSDILLGQYSVAGLKSDGSVWECLYKSRYNYEPTIRNDISGVKAISSYFGSHFLALKNDGLVYSWGLNSSGQLGDRTNTNSETAVQVVTLTDVHTIIATDFSSYALKKDGTLWSWGANNDGHLGNGLTNVHSNEPVPVTGQFKREETPIQLQDIPQVSKKR
jgi:YD repeat-containing protein